MNAIIVVFGGMIKEIPLSEASPISKFFPNGVSNIKSVVLISGTRSEVINLRTLLPSGENMPLISPGMALLVGEISPEVSKSVDTWIKNCGSQTVDEKESKKQVKSIAYESAKSGSTDALQSGAKETNSQVILSRPTPIFEWWLWIVGLTVLAFTVLIFKKKSSTSKK